MSTETDDLICALRNYDTAKQAHDEAMEQSDCSWGYFGYRHIKALEEAGEEFANALERVIDSRIKIYLESIDSAKKP